MFLGLRGAIATVPDTVGTSVGGLGVILSKKPEFREEQRGHDGERGVLPE